MTWIVGKKKKKKKTKQKQQQQKKKFFSTWILKNIFQIWIYFWRFWIFWSISYLSPFPKFFPFTQFRKTLLKPLKIFWKKNKKLRSPGIEPGSITWQATIITTRSRALNYSKKAPEVRLELTTYRLTAGRATDCAIQEIRKLLLQKPLCFCCCFWYLLIFF